jgi:hypothetical protein
VPTGWHKPPSKSTREKTVRKETHGKNNLLEFSPSTINQERAPAKAMVTM